MIEKALFKMAGVKQTECEKVHVDVASELEKLGLHWVFPDEFWPSVELVSELATKLKALRKKCGHDQIFVQVDLKKFVPSYLTDFAALPRGEDKPAPQSVEDLMLSLQACIRVSEC